MLQSKGRTSDTLFMPYTRSPPPGPCPRRQNARLASRAPRETSTMSRATAYRSSPGSRLAGYPLSSVPPTLPILDFSRSRCKTESRFYGRRSHAGHHRSSYHPRAARGGSYLQGLAPGGSPPHADEQPRPRSCRTPRGASGLRRDGQGRQELGELLGHRQYPARTGRRRDVAGPVRKAGGRLQDTPLGPAGSDRQFPPRPGMGRLEDVQGTREGRTHYVRPDDRGVVDLYRHPGHPSGHLRDVRRRRRTTLRGERCAAESA